MFDFRSAIESQVSVEFFGGLSFNRESQTKESQILSYSARRGTGGQGAVDGMGLNNENEVVKRTAAATLPKWDSRNGKKPARGWLLAEPSPGM